MTIIDPATGWFEIVEVPTYDRNDLTGDNDYYIDNPVLEQRMAKQIPASIQSCV